MFGAAKSASGGKLKISISPNPAAWALANYLQDWPQWISRGFCDNAIVQIYRDNVESFRRELESPSLLGLQSRVAIGILSGQRTKLVSMNLIRDQVLLTRQKGYQGYVFFFYESLFRFRPPTETEPGRKAVLQGFQPELSKDPDGF